VSPTTTMTAANSFSIVASVVLTVVLNLLAR
jgi:hypothetical protein